MARDAAERKHGFRLYQGGSVPGARLRVVEIPKWDIEACGGTHCARTSEVGLVKILRTSRIQDGVVRLEYVAGTEAIAFVQKQSQTVDALRGKLGVPADQVVDAVGRLQDEAKDLRKRVESLERGSIRAALHEPTTAEVVKQVHLGDRGIDIRVSPAASARVWHAVVSPGSPDDLRRLAIPIVNEAGNVVVLAARNASASILVARSADVSLDCLSIARDAASLLGGGAGGASDFAQGGGTKLEGVDAALDAAITAVRRSLG